MIVSLFSVLSSTFFSKAEPYCLPVFHPVLCFPDKNLHSVLSSRPVNAAFFTLLPGGHYWIDDRKGSDLPPVFLLSI